MQSSVLYKQGEQMSLFVTETQVVITAPIQSRIDVQIVDSAEKLAALVDEMNNAEMIAFDTETTSTEEMSAELVGISLAMQGGEGILHPSRASIRTKLAGRSR